MHIHTYILTHTHAYIHTYMHTHTHIKHCPLPARNAVWNPHCLLAHVAAQPAAATRRRERGGRERGRGLCFFAAVGPAGQTACAGS